MGTPQIVFGKSQTRSVGYLERLGHRLKQPQQRLAGKISIGPDGSSFNQEREGDSVLALQAGGKSHLPEQEDVMRRAMEEMRRAVDASAWRKISRTEACPF